jgi:hypothetical protein
MMKRTAVNAPDAPQPAGSYAQAIEAAGRTHLAFHDDRQIKVLSVSYHLSPVREALGIRVELGRLSDLRQDLAFIERIRRGAFERDEDDWRNRRSASGRSPFVA